MMFAPQICAVLLLNKQQDDIIVWCSNARDPAEWHRQNHLAGFMVNACSSTAPQSAAVVTIGSSLLQTPWWGTEDSGLQSYQRLHDCFLEDEVSQLFVCDGHTSSVLFCMPSATSVNQSESKCLCRSIVLDRKVDGTRPFFVHRHVMAE
jgi:hypothetical protein